MRATLIKLEPRVVDIPDHRPYYRELVRENGIPLTANYESMDLTTAPMMDVKVVDYRLVVIRGGNANENGCYMINDDMWYKAMPILEDIVQKRLRPLEKENMGLKVAFAERGDIIKMLKKLWFVRFYYWISNLLTTTKE